MVIILSAPNVQGTGRDWGAATPFQKGCSKRFYPPANPEGQPEGAPTPIYPETTANFADLRNFTDVTPWREVPNLYSANLANLNISSVEKISVNDILCAAAVFRLEKSIQNVCHKGLFFNGF
jgi:hypothetical protein